MLTAPSRRLARLSQTARPAPKPIQMPGKTAQRGRRLPKKEKQMWGRAAVLQRPVMLYRKPLQVGGL